MFVLSLHHPVLQLSGHQVGVLQLNSVLISYPELVWDAMAIRTQSHGWPSLYRKANPVSIWSSSHLHFSSVRPQIGASSHPPSHWQFLLEWITELKKVPYSLLWHIVKDTAHEQPNGRGVWTKVSSPRCSPPSQHLCVPTGKLAEPPGILCLSLMIIGKSYVCAYDRLARTNWFT